MQFNTCMFDHIVDVGRRASDRVHHARQGVGSDVRLHAGYHWLPFFV